MIKREDIIMMVFLASSTGGYMIEHDQGMKGHITKLSPLVLAAILLIGAQDEIGRIAYIPSVMAERERRDILMTVPLFSL